MPLTLLADRQYTAPSAATSVSITPSGTSWASSAYVTLLASTPAACVLTGVVVSTALGESTSSTHAFEIDIATGAASAEVVIATVRGANYRTASLVQAGPSCCCVLPIPIDNIASGVRLSARMRKEGTTTTTPYKVAITYLQKPLASAPLTTAKVQKIIPSAATGTTLTAGSPAFASGAWVQLRAASGAALVVTGVACGAPSATNIYEIDLGTGAAAAETVVTTFPAYLGSVIFPAWLMLPTPLDNIAASTRVAARLRCNTASATLQLALMVLEKPL